MRQRYFRVKHRVVNWWRDVRDKRRGFCCELLLNPSEGGYHFWRCGLPRDHDGAHRFGNYIWPAENGRTAYVPTEDMPPRLDRYPTRTRAQNRSYGRWFDSAMRKRGLRDPA